MKKHNLFESIPGDLPEELVEILADGRGTVRIERIVSRGHASPPGFWYDQDTTEWVVLLRGSAILRIEQEPEPIKLRPGDCIKFPPHCRHRVEQTAKTEDTVWLAVHWG